jgi:hypothetical protein
LAVIDASRSQEFAEEAAKLISDRVWFLCSGWGESVCSATVISDDPRTNLPRIPGDLLKGKSMPFQESTLTTKGFRRPFQPPTVAMLRRGHSMFSRSFMLEVVYGDANPLVLELPSVLNRPGVDNVFLQALLEPLVPVALVCGISFHLKSALMLCRA